MRFEESRRPEGNPAATGIPERWHGTRWPVVLGEEGAVVRPKAKLALGGSGELVPLRVFGALPNRQKGAGEWH